MLKGVRTSEDRESGSRSAWGLEERKQLAGHREAGPAGTQPEKLHRTPTSVISSAVLHILGVTSWIALGVWGFPGQVLWEDKGGRDSRMMERRIRNEKP